MKHNILYRYRHGNCEIISAKIGNFFPALHPFAFIRHAQKKLRAEKKLTKNVNCRFFAHCSRRKLYVLISG